MKKVKMVKFEEALILQKHIEQVLQFYISYETEAFYKSPACAELFALAERLGYHVECSFGYENEKRKTCIYMNFAVKDDHGEGATAGEYDEYVHLTGIMQIIEIDRKERVKFYSWEEDDDFIDSINWAARELKKKL